MIHLKNFHNARYFAFSITKYRFRNYSQTNEEHIPVMLQEVIYCLKPEEKQVFVDMTFGNGGHSKKLLSSSPHLQIIALDRDRIAYEKALNLSKEFPNRLIPLLGKFSDLPKLLKELKICQNNIDGFFFDFGCSSMQLDTASRGFSLSQNGPLDMRMDLNSDCPTAADVLKNAPEEDLAKILKVYGEEKYAKKIARSIVETRFSFKNLQTTHELANLIETVCSNETSFRLDKLQRKSHLATKTFQALRIFVNNELNEINYGLLLAHRYLKLGGRLVTLTFHSLEDTIVKRHLTGLVADNAATNFPLRYVNHTISYAKEVVSQFKTSNWQSLYKHVLTPSEEEVLSNPRSRSAKLRAAIKIR